MIMVTVQPVGHATCSSDRWRAVPGATPASWPRAGSPSRGLADGGVPNTQDTPLTWPGGARSRAPHMSRGPSGRRRTRPTALGPTPDGGPSDEAGQDSECRPASDREHRSSSHAALGGLRLCLDPTTTLVAAPDASRSPKAAVPPAPGHAGTIAQAQLSTASWPSTPQRTPVPSHVRRWSSRRVPSLPPKFQANRLNRLLTSTLPELQCYMGGDDDRA